MAGFQLTIRTPNGKGWRIRTTSAASFEQVLQEVVLSAAERLKLSDLQALWPDGTAARWQAFSQDALNGLFRTVQLAIARGDLDILKTGGTRLFRDVQELMQESGWTQWDNLTSHLVKVLIAAGMAYLRTQFPVISPKSAQVAVDLLGRLLSGSARSS